jgi:hypothetical protein
VHAIFSACNLRLRSSAVLTYAVCRIRSTKALWELFSRGPHKCVHGRHINSHLQMASGILIYMGLVDLLATDIFSEHMRSQRTRFQVGCLTAVTLGATAMVRLSNTSQSFPGISRVNI